MSAFRHESADVHVKVKGKLCSDTTDQTIAARHTQVHVKPFLE